jgi:hypothetical protein
MISMIILSSLKQNWPYAASRLRDSNLGQAIVTETIADRLVAIIKETTSRSDEDPKEEQGEC